MSSKGFDIVGDIQGCLWEFEQLLEHLGYFRHKNAWQHPNKRKMVLIGNLLGAGPDNLKVLSLATDLVNDGVAQIGAIGNYDFQIYIGFTNQTKIRADYALIQVAKQVKGAENQFFRYLKNIYHQAPAFSIFANKLVVVHAAIRPAAPFLVSKLHPDWSDAISQKAIFGEDSPPEKWYPTYSWFDTWARGWTVVYSSNPAGSEPTLKGRYGNVIGIDTGVAYGGRLSVFRWPQKEVVSVGSKDIFIEHEKDFCTDEEPGSIVVYSWKDLQSFTNKYSEPISILPELELEEVSFKANS